jgi:hypothetical protein
MNSIKQNEPKFNVLCVNAALNDLHVYYVLNVLAHDALQLLGYIYIYIYIALM